METQNNARKQENEKRPKSVVDLVVNWTVQQIIDGKLKPGSQLPTELELCQTLGIGRNSAREGIKKLEAYGIVYIKRAEGTFVADSYSQKMLDPMLYGLLLQNDDWMEFVDFRRALDIGILSIVTSQESSMENMAKLHRALAYLEEVVSDPNSSYASVQNADNQFHFCLAEMTNNRMIQTLATYIERLTIRSRLETTQFIIEQGMRREYVQMHQQIAHIVESGDVSQVGEVVANHYRFWQRDIP